MSRLLVIVAVAVFCLPVRAEQWDKDVGKPAPALIGAGWVGTPVSLDALKGNTVVLAFWNADVPC